MSSLRCPVCKADNEQGPNCRRCKADLTLLFELEEHRARLLDDARQFLSEGRRNDFLDAVEQAHHLREDVDTRRWRAAARLLIGDREAALKLARIAQEKPA